MNVSGRSRWARSDICAEVPDTPGDISSLAAIAYERVCRFDFSAPGFFLIDLGSKSSSEILRQTMVDLKRAMGTIHTVRAGRDLVYLSAGRFDQQATTKAHRDGGPDECFLMLGYEPAAVGAELVLSDYSKCAFDMGMTPAEFLDRHNPMFVAGEELLRPYTTTVECYSQHRFQVLLINNSIAPYDAEKPVWQGVLHTATVKNRSDREQRVVNSTMIASVPPGTDEPVSPAARNRNS